MSEVANRYSINQCQDQCAIRSRYGADTEMGPSSSWRGWRISFQAETDGWRCSARGSRPAICWSYCWVKVVSFKLLSLRMISRFLKPTESHPLIIGRDSDNIASFIWIHTPLHDSSQAPELEGDQASVILLSSRPCYDTTCLTWLLNLPIVQSMSLPLFTTRTLVLWPSFSSPCFLYSLLSCL